MIRARDVGEIVGDVIETLRVRHSYSLPGRFRGSVGRRVRQLLELYEEPDVVATVVCAVALQDGRRFSAQSLATDRFDRMVFRSRIPDGGWYYERWFMTLEPGTELHDLVEYWLGQWRDAHATGDSDGIKKATGQLAGLRNEHLDPEPEVIER